MKAILRSRGSNNDHQQYVENKAGCIQITESSPDTIGPTVIHWLIVNGVTRAGSRIRSHHNRPTINIWRAVRGGVGAYFTHPDHPSGLLCWNFHFVKDRKFEIEARNCIWVKSFSPPLGSSASQGRDMSGGGRWLTYENQTGKKRKSGRDWHEKISNSQSVTLERATFTLSGQVREATKSEKYSMIKSYFAY